MEPNYLLRMVYGGDPLEELDERGPVELGKSIPFDTGTTPVDPIGATLHKITWLERKTPAVNPAEARLHREKAAIDNRFAGMYKAIAAEETTTFARDNLWQPERKSSDRLAKGAPLQLFMRLSKIDEEQRLVYGVATAEIPDRDGEICDYAESKPHFQTWSESVQKDSQGKSKGNLREMHQLSAVGTLSQIQFNDSAKQIEICAQITDDAAWKKVKTGTYVGFSVGGRYSRRWQDAGTNLTRYAAIPCEISLVDRPCVPNATFSMVKAESVEEILGLVNA